MVDQIIARHTGGFGDMLQDQRSKASEIKAQTEASSQQRLEELREQERRYRQRIAEAQARRDAEQQKIMKVVLLAAVGLVGLLVAGALLLLLLYR